MILLTVCPMEICICFFIKMSHAVCFLPIYQFSTLTVHKSERRPCSSEILIEIQIHSIICPSGVGKRSFKRDKSQK